MSLSVLQRLWCDLRARNSISRELEAAKDKIRSLMNTVMELRGTRLDRLDQHQLQELMLTHKVAMDRTQQALLLEER